MDAKSLILFIAGGLIFIFVIGQISGFTGKTVEKPWDIQCSRYNTIKHKGFLNTEVDKFGPSPNTAEYVKLVINEREYRHDDKCLRYEKVRDYFCSTDQFGKPTVKWRDIGCNFDEKCTGGRCRPA